LLRVKFQGEESDSCFLCLHGLVSRKQAADELSELQDDGNGGSKGLSSVGGESRHIHQGGLIHTKRRELRLMLHIELKILRCALSHYFNWYFSLFSF
jgi:hypothetical protein